jgi:hypothetical protein
MCCSVSSALPKLQELDNIRVQSVLFSNVTVDFDMRFAPPIFFWASKNTLQLWACFPACLKYACLKYACLKYACRMSYGFSSLPKLSTEAYVWSHEFVRTSDKVLPPRQISRHAFWSPTCCSPPSPSLHSSSRSQRPECHVWFESHPLKH